MSTVLESLAYHLAGFLRGVRGHVRVSMFSCSFVCFWVADNFTPVSKLQTGFNNGGGATGDARVQLMVFSRSSSLLSIKLSLFIEVSPRVPCKCTDSLIAHILCIRNYMSRVTLQRESNELHWLIKFSHLAVISLQQCPEYHDISDRKWLSCSVLA